MPANLVNLELMATMLENSDRGPAAREVRAAIAELTELRARPAIPPWTRGRPTEPGWYWIRAHGTLQGIWYVTAAGRALGMGRNAPEPWWEEAEWSGPIPEPKEGS